MSGLFKDFKPSWSNKGVRDKKNIYTSNTSIKQIEDWLTEQLVKDMPEKERTYKSALNYFKIDKLTLSEHGLQVSDTERLYRSLYVTTFTFFQTLSALIN